MSTDAAAPYSATVELGIYATSPADAWAVLGQIRAALEEQATTKSGGVAVHHSVTSVTLRRS